MCDLRYLKQEGIFVNDNNDVNDPLSGKIVTEVMRFTDAKENGIVMGVGANGIRNRFVFPMNVASQMATGLIDGLADAGDPLATKIRAMLTKPE